MILWKKAVVSLAAASMILSPVAASAAPALNASDVSVTEGQNELEGANWIAIVLGLAIIAGGIWLAVDGDDDPVSP